MSLWRDSWDAFSSFLSKIFFTLLFGMSRSFFSLRPPDFWQSCKPNNSAKVNKPKEADWHKTPTARTVGSNLIQGYILF